MIYLVLGYLVPGLLTLGWVLHLRPWLLSPAPWAWWMALLVVPAWPFFWVVVALQAWREREDQSSTVGTGGGGETRAHKMPVKFVVGPAPEDPETIERRRP